MGTFNLITWWSVYSYGGQSFKYIANSNAFNLEKYMNRGGGQGQTRDLPLTNPKRFHHTTTIGLNPEGPSLGP